MSASHDVRAFRSALLQTIITIDWARKRDALTYAYVHVVAPLSSTNSTVIGRRPWRATALQKPNEM